MYDNKEVFEEVKGLYKIIPLKPFRETPGVSFHVVPKDIFTRVDGIDRVVHTGGAISPGPVGDVERPWYMHPFQEDYLLVLQGIRYTDVYTVDHGIIERFEVSADKIVKNGKVLYDGPAMLVWPCSVFHRIRSDDKIGSISLNFAVRHDGFDIDTNFSIYSVDVEKGKYKVIRKGSLDQC